MKLTKTTNITVFLADSTTGVLSVYDFPGVSSHPFKLLGAITKLPDSITKLPGLVVKLPSHTLKNSVEKSNG